MVNAMPEGRRGRKIRPFGKLEMLGLPTNLSHVTDVTIGKGRKVAIPSLEEFNLGRARGLVDWKHRFLLVPIPSVYSKTELPRLPTQTTWN
jgi:hypothetical protein